MTELCAPWITDLIVCDLTDPDPDDVARAIEVASDLLFEASGRQFRGVCTDTIQPCSSGCGQQWLAYPDGSSRPLPLSADGCTCGSVPKVGVDGDVVWCDGRIYSAIRLPNTPVVDVTEIVIDGVTLDPSEWRIVDSRWVIRTDGTGWPCCTHLTDPDNWHVTYRWGPAVPLGGQVAASVLACELIKGWTGGQCRLPRRVTQVTREGLSYTLLDSFDDLAGSGFGLVEVASWVQSVNPAGLAEPAKLVVPSLQKRRARRVR